MTDEHPVSGRGLVKRYGEIVAVDHVDLTVEAGDVFGYLGPNGAGKTTSLRMMLGLIRPTEGYVRLFGLDPLVDGARALDGVAGFVEGPAFYPYLSGRRNLQLLADYDGGAARARIEAMQAASSSVAVCACERPRIMRSPSRSAPDSSVQSQRLAFTSTPRTSTPCSRALRTSCAGA